MKYDEALQFVRDYVHRKTGISLSQIKEESRLIRDLGLSSLEVMDFCLELEKKPGIEVSDDEFPEVITAEDMAVLIRDKTENQDRVDREIRERRRILAGIDCVRD